MYKIVDTIFLHLLVNSPGEHVKDSSAGCSTATLRSSGMNLKMQELMLPCRWKLSRIPLSWGVF